MRLTAKLDPGWHLYSLTTPPGGPIPTTAALAENPAIASSKFYQPKPERKFDPNFGIDTETFQKEVVFLIQAVIEKDAATGPAELTAQVRYQTCNDAKCLPPKNKAPAFTLTVDPSAPAAAALVIPAGYTEVKPELSPLRRLLRLRPRPKLPAAWRDFPADCLRSGLGCDLHAVRLSDDPDHGFVLPEPARRIAAGGGVFARHHRAILRAGLGVTAAVGPFGVVQLGSNPWVNGFIALVFGAFALSLLGAFEITLPSGLLTKLDNASRRGGYLGTLLMGLTFSLTSFACVGPFVGSCWSPRFRPKASQPVLGMVSFATGLASPFFFLAAFPSYLKKLPRSGGWLVRVKVVMGFVLLALMFKYLSNIDQVLQTNWLTRERFLAAWFVLFAMAGLYLLGLLRLEGVEAGRALGIGRLLTASAFLIFAFSLLPECSARRSANWTRTFPAGNWRRADRRERSADAGPPWMKNQYQRGAGSGRASRTSWCW